MPHPENGDPTFVVAIMCPGANIGDVIAALRLQNLSSLQTIRLQDYRYRELPEWDGLYSLFFVYGQGRTQHVHTREEFDTACRSAGGIGVSS